VKGLVAGAALVGDNALAKRELRCLRGIDEKTALATQAAACGGLVPTLSNASDPLAVGAVFVRDHGEAPMRPSPDRGTPP
jgi:hypothetical protein